MKKVSLENRRHSFGKTNLVTKRDKKGHYDEQQCQKCGLKGKLYGFDSFIVVPDTTPDEQINGCTPQADPFIGKKIKVTFCEAHSPAFSNCTPESVHKIIEPLEGYFNGSIGVFIMGVGEPVQLLFSEFTFVKGFKRTTKPRAKNDL